MLSEKIIEERFYIEKISEEVRSVRAEMKRNNYIRLSIRSASAAAIILFSYFSIYLIQLTPNKIIEDKCYTNYTRSSQVLINKEPSQLEVALQQINSNEFSKALETLEKLPGSDHKDWFLLNAHLGLEDFKEVDILTIKIRGDKEHLYYSQIDNYFLYDIYLLKVKRKVLK